MKKVSFDFDQTLSTKEVQEFVKNLKGVEKWIVTRRYEDIDSYDEEFCRRYRIPHDRLIEEHENLFKVAAECGIKREHIHFCNMQSKADYLIDKDFILHLDDKQHELDEIKEKDATIGVTHINNQIWQAKIKSIIRKSSRKRKQ